MKSERNDITADIIFKQPVHFLAFGFGSGLSPVAPGTAGTLAAIPLFLLLSTLPPVVYWLLVVLIVVAGVWICSTSSRLLGVHDHPGIVWDEIAGFLITAGVAPMQWPWILLSFVLFRAFDIFKPYPIGAIDRKLTGGLGIMLDDVVAGIFGGVVIALLAWFI